MTGQTLEDRITEAGNRPSGFDYLRLILATLVVVSHTVNVCYGIPYTGSVWTSPVRPFLAIILPMFFALSGFLVAGSLERCRTLISFLGLRVLRLVPALAVDTMLAAFVIGPIFTVVAYDQYFTDPRFFRYFLNIVGEIHYTLPGVFERNPWPDAVNQQLWTLPYELKCYAAIAGLALIGFVRHARRFLMFLVASAVAIVVVYVFVRGAQALTTVPGSVLVECFLVGIGGYLLRGRIVWSLALFVASSVLTLVLLSVPAGDYFAAIPITYVTIYIGLTEPRRVKLISSGDYSYGIFLYGFSIQQSVVALLGVTGTIWYVNLAIALPVTCAFAAFSWWCVEKPALLLRPLLFRLEDFALRVGRGVPGGRFVLAPLTAPRIARTVNPAALAG